jgi:hypothetical protein
MLIVTMSNFYDNKGGIPLSFSDLMFAHSHYEQFPSTIEGPLIFIFLDSKFAHSQY